MPLRRVGAAIAFARSLVAPPEDEDVRTLKEAVLRLTEQLAGMQVSAANQLVPPGPTVADLVTWWKDTKAFRRLSSKEDRRHHLDGYVLPALGEHTQETLTSDAVEKMLEGAREKGELAGSTLNAIRAALSKVINDAKSTVPPRWTGANPVSGVERYETVEREPPMLAPAQAWGVIQAAPPHWRALFAVAIYLGLRAGELRGLKVEDVDPLHRKLHVRRSGRREGTKAGAGKTRSIPVPEELWPFLAQARKDKAGGAFLFGHGGFPLTKNWKSADLCRAVLKKAGLFASIFWACNRRNGCGLVVDEEPDGGRCPECNRKLRRTTKPLEMDFHDLRHVSATLHQEAGCHPWVMSKVLGHSMPKTMTTRYTHLSDEMVRAELSRLKLRTDLNGGGPGGTGGEHHESPDTSVSEGDSQVNIGARSSVWIEHRTSNPVPQLNGGTPETSESPSPVAVAKFWSAVARGAPAACWFWTGGQGHTRLFGRQESVRRVAYRLTHGAVGQKQAVLTTCGNDLCCNVAHLFTVPLGTPKASPGAANGRAKLTATMVVEIRRAHAAGELSIKQLARINGVSPKAIRKVLSGETWREGQQ